MASTKTYSTAKLLNTRVVGGKKGTRRVGKVVRFVFHPSEKRCVGFLVKRPDLALMFHRNDLFVPLDGFEMEDERVRLNEDMKQGYGPAAIRRLGLDWESCTLWEGMPVLTASGKDLGLVGDVVFSRATGKIVSVQARRGSINKALLGELIIPAALIRGFKTGVGNTVLTFGQEEVDGEGQVVTGAIVVDDAVSQIQNEGGLADAAGRATAKATNQVKQAAEDTAAALKPAASEAAKATGKAVNAGARTVGKQLGRSTGMFQSFKSEYDKAIGKDDAGKAKKKDK